MRFSRKVKALVGILFGLWFGCISVSFAISFGELRLFTALGEPLNAEISLGGTGTLAAADVHVKLASSEDYRRLGLEPEENAQDLVFEVVSSSGAGSGLLVHISSKRAISDPTLSLLLQIDWPRGQLFRKYTLLLDPPDEAGPEYRQTQSSREQPKALPPPKKIPTRYGPTIASDELWKISRNVRPDPSVSMDQVMVAILQANPDAFSEGNINQLKTGEVLAIPNREAMLAMSAPNAEALVGRQNKDWKEGTVSPTNMASKKLKPAGAFSSFLNQKTVDALKSVSKQHSEAAPVSPKESAPKVASYDAELPSISNMEEKPSAALPSVHPTLSVSTLGSSLEANRSVQSEEEDLTLTEKERHLKTEVALSAEAYRATSRENQALKAHMNELEQKLGRLENQLVQKDEMLLDAQKELDRTGHYHAPVSVRKALLAPPTQELTQKPEAPEASHIAAAEAPVPVSQTAEMPPLAVTAMLPKAEQAKETSGTPAWQTVLWIVLPLSLIAFIGWFALWWREHVLRTLKLAIGMPPQAGMGPAPAPVTPVPPSRPAPMPLPTTPAPENVAAPAATKAAVVTTSLDPLEEAKVYIAYRRHDQAEMVLLKALELQPLRIDLIMKLLETYDELGNALELLKWIKRLPKDVATRSPEYLPKLESLQQKYHVLQTPVNPAPVPAEPIEPIVSAPAPKNVIEFESIAVVPPSSSPDQKETKSEESGSTDKTALQNLELGLAYIDIGDIEGALPLLESASQSGSDAIKKRALEALSTIQK